MSLNILIVDDSAVVRAMIAKTLRLAGVPIAEVHEAGNGQEGLDVLESRWVDLVFADINMPVMNGEEMIRRIRANTIWADLSLIIISTEGSETRINGLLDAHARFIHKPFTPERLRNVVTEMLGIAHEPTSA
jgi:two-component system, chemotaxis family, chemotaxis protein CheY